MFNRKRELLDIIQKQSFRIQDLEERLCPCNQHDWVKIGRTVDYINDCEYKYHVKCKRCGKESTKTAGDLRDGF